MVAGVVEDEPLGIHAGVVGEDAGVEGRRMMGLEPGRLVGRQCECRGMRLAEAEGCEGAQDIPDLLDDPERIAPAQCRRVEPHPHLVDAGR